MLQQTTLLEVIISLITLHLRNYANYHEKACITLYTKICLTLLIFSPIY